MSFLSDTISGRIVAWLSSRVGSFFGPSSTAIRGYINVDELFRVVLTAAMSGGSALAVLTAIGGDLAAIFPNPADVSLASAFVAFVVELFRRIGHGSVGVSVSPSNGTISLR